MVLPNRVRISAIVAASAIVSFASSAFAQDITESHLKAARDAVAAIHATDPFDAILPQAAASLQQQLIQKNPDKQELIINTVSQKAIDLASRRADLEKEAANAYAKVFSEKELNDIAAFYNSDSGKKLLDNGPIVSRELVKAADIWQNGVARDLGEQVGQALASAAGVKPKPADAPAPDAPAATGQ